MRILLYIVILSLLFLAPVKRLDVASLGPVQTVGVRIVDGQVIVQTDTKNKGQADNLQAAINDLEKRTPGVIYLDTAQYLLITQDAVCYAKELEKYFHPSVKVSLWDGKGSVEKAAKFLEIRRDLPTLRRWNEDKWNAVEKS